MQARSWRKCSGGQSLHLLTRWVSKPIFDYLNFHFNSFARGKLCKDFSSWRVLPLRAICRYVPIFDAGCWIVAEYWTSKCYNLLFLTPLINDSPHF